MTQFDSILNTLADIADADDTPDAIVSNMLNYINGLKDRGVINKHTHILLWAEISNETYIDNNVKKLFSDEFRDAYDDAAIIPDQRRIVCAATKFGEQIILSVHHGDPFLMSNVIGNNLIPSNTIRNSVAGFIDNQYNFLNRHEALKVAIESGQVNIDNRVVYPADELFSEELY